MDPNRKKAIAIIGAGSISALGMVAGTRLVAKAPRSMSIQTGPQVTPNPFRIDEIMCGYEETPENRKRLKALFDEAKPKLKTPLPANFDYGTASRA